MTDKGKTAPVTVLIVGIGGYGYYYLRTLLEKFPPGEVELCGAIDPAPEKSPIYPELQRRSIPLFPRIEDFYASGGSADLAVIASPLHYHAPQSIVALQSGSCVLCDKPLAATIQDADALLRTRDETGRWVMVGYQWSYSRAIQALKRDIIAGVFGKSRRLKTICLWPRGDDYYQRNDWAGRIKADNGRWILDSPAGNAMAHFLHNLLYLLGEQPHLSVLPAEISAETYRVNPIENYDTVASRIRTENGAEILFFASHAGEQQIDPRFELDFEKAVVSYGGSHQEITAEFPAGEVNKYGSPDDDDQFLKLFRAVEKVKHPAAPIHCGPEAARPQVLCVNGIQESVGEIIKFPLSLRCRDEKEKRWWVEGLDEALMECYRKGILPAEAGYSWARVGRTIDLRGYRRFPGG